MNKQLEQAIILSVEAHAGQKDKAGKPYVLHPLRVMAQVELDITKIVAVLHDVIEDTTVTELDLYSLGFTGEILDALKLLTHDPKVPYMDYIREIGKNRIAKEVKLADLEDNMDLTRIKLPTTKDYARMERYREAYSILTK